MRRLTISFAFTPQTAAILAFTADFANGSLGKEPVGEINHLCHPPAAHIQLQKSDDCRLDLQRFMGKPNLHPHADSHLSDQLAKRGARIIFHAVNGGRSRGEWSDVNWNFSQQQLAHAARASNLWIVTVDSCEPIDIRCSAFWSGQIHMAIGALEPATTV